MAGNKLKQITTRAKALRRSSPGMSWHNAQRKAAAMLRSGTSAPRKKTKAKHHTTAVAKTHHHKKRSVGATMHTTTTKRKKKKSTSFLGATHTNTMDVLQSGGGIIGGIIITHVGLRPLEHKAISMISNPKIQRYASQAMPWVELFGGLAGALLSKNKIVRKLSLGVAAAGGNTAMKQLPMHMHSPAETINGVGEFVQTRIPINGTIRERISGLIQQEGYTKTPTVGRSIVMNDNRAVNTPTVGNHDMLLNSTPTVGEYEEDDEMLFRTNHFAR